MIQVRRNWPEGLEEMQRQMEQFLEHMVSRKRPMVVFSTGKWRPPVDVYENAREIVVLVELAGMKGEEVEVIAERESLTLRGIRKDVAAEKRDRYHQMEINFGAFERTVHLPVPVDPNQTSATYGDGFLQITLPKLSNQGTTRVNIHTGR